MNAMEIDTEWVSAMVSVYQKLACELICQPHGMSSDRLDQRLRSPKNQAEMVYAKYLAYESLIRCAEACRVSHIGDAMASLLASLVKVKNGDTSIASVAGWLDAIGRLERVATDAVVLPERLKAYLDVRFMHRIRIPALATRFGVSNHRIRSTFVARYGVTIQRYVTLQRVTRGLELVRRGVKVEVASMEVGYRSKKDFYRAVRSCTGETPKHARA